VSDGLILLGLLVGAVNAFSYARALKEVKTSISYPIFNASSLTLVTLASIFIFSEAVSLLKITRIVVIGLGVVLITA
jgi:multidrug transporter EmrE-like cation transporter